MIYNPEQPQPTKNLTTGGLGKFIVNGSQNVSVNESLSRSPQYINRSYSSKAGPNAFNNASTIKNNHDSGLNMHQRTDRSSGLILKKKNQMSNQNLLNKFSRKVLGSPNINNAKAETDRRILRGKNSRVQTKSVDLLARGPNSSQQFSTWRKNGSRSPERQDFINNNPNYGAHHQFNNNPRNPQFQSEKFAFQQNNLNRQGLNYPQNTFHRRHSEMNNRLPYKMNQSRNGFESDRNQLNRSEQQNGYFEQRPNNYAQSLQNHRPISSHNLGGGRGMIGTRKFNQNNPGLPVNYARRMSGINQRAPSPNFGPRVRGVKSYSNLHPRRANTPDIMGRNRFIHHGSINMNESLESTGNIGKYSIIFNNKN